MANHFGMLAKGTPLVSYRDVRVTRGGKTWTASWHVDEGKLFVSSAYGSRTEPVGRRKNLGDRAEQILGEIIEARP